METAEKAYPMPGSAVNAAVLPMRVSLLECPSDNVPPGATSYRVCLGSSPFVGDRPNRGAYFSAGGGKGLASWTHIRDGLSNTVLCSEKIVGDFDEKAFVPFRDTLFVNVRDFRDPATAAAVCARLPASKTSPHSSFAGATWLLNGYAYTWYNHVLTPNSRSPDCTNGGYVLAQAATTARSWHGPGVNAAMADGAVRFVSESIDLQIWRALGTRSGAERVGDW